MPRPFLCRFLRTTGINKKERMKEDEWAAHLRMNGLVCLGLRRE